MAIGLNDVNKKKLKNKERDHASQQKSIRPWDSIHDQELQTRTYSAQEAVKRARDIVEKNKDIIEDLHSRRREKSVWRETEEKNYFEEDEIVTPLQILSNENSTFSEKIKRFLNI